MFIFFVSFYMAMLSGSWRLFTMGDVSQVMRTITNGIGTFLTSLFNNVDTPMATLGDTLFASNSLSTYNYYWVISIVLATITSIGIVVVAAKGIKKLFTVFFYGVR